MSSNHASADILATRQATLADPLTLPSGAVIKNRILKGAMNEALGDRGAHPTEPLGTSIGIGRAAAPGCCSLEM
ncbi:Protein of unknown function [Propionibacterium freudenreichii]|uniref:hypothetical protein n=1 Tax=Propionibacterium freudenreichii TaxID=1744 RepID=UPI0005A5C4DA|nr:hypothetical protein [Propionibacterium freudenreichii]CEI24804.1 Protein of unknown function [Propionibacterium freudenreichii]